MNEKSLGRLVGYTRVSTNAQELHLQTDALKKAGCSPKNIFHDKVSGSKSERPGLNACLRELKKGDTLLVWRLDRLGRSLRDLIDLVEQLRDRGIAFKSVSDGAIDTSSASGELIFHVFSALAQFERRLIQERTRAGLCAARARGRLGGRKPLSSSNPKVQTAKNLFADRKMTIPDICSTLGISRPTLYRWVSIPPSPTTL